MNRRTVLAAGVLGCAIFVAGWAFGSAQYRYNAANWKALTSFERVLFVTGFHQGYGSASDVKTILARQDLTSSQRALAEHLDRQLAGSGQHMTVGEIVTGMSTFYDDYRNQPVCWAEALTFSVNALNGTPPSEQELKRTREGSAKSGCE
jgi:hypothetical protein